MGISKTKLPKRKVNRNKTTFWIISMFLWARIKLFDLTFQSDLKWDSKPGTHFILIVKHTLITLGTAIWTYLYEIKPKDFIMLYFLIGKNRIKLLDSSSNGNYDRQTKMWQQHLTTTITMFLSSFHIMLVILCHRQVKQNKSMTGMLYSHLGISRWSIAI